jgi:hypothetical protein
METVVHFSPIVINSTIAFQHKKMILLPYIVRSMLLIPEVKIITEIQHGLSLPEIFW